MWVTNIHSQSQNLLILQDDSKANSPSLSNCFTSARKTKPTTSSGVMCLLRGVLVYPERNNGQDGFQGQQQSLISPQFPLPSPWIIVSYENIFPQYSPMISIPSPQSTRLPLPLPPTGWLIFVLKIPSVIDSMYKRYHIIIKTINIIISNSHSS